MLKRTRFVTDTIKDCAKNNKPWTVASVHPGEETVLERKFPTALVFKQDVDELWIVVPGVHQHEFDFLMVL